MNKTCVEALEIWGLDGDIVVFKDGSLGTAFSLQPIDTSCWTDEECNVFAERLRAFVCGLPEGLLCQFLFRVKGGTDGTIRDFDSLIASDSTSTARFLAKARSGSISNSITKGEIGSYGLYFIIRKIPEGSLVGKRGIFARSSQISAQTQESQSHRVSEMGGIANLVRGSLSALDLVPTQLAGQDILRLIYSFWNPSRPVDLSRLDPHDVRDSLIFSDISIHHGGFAVGDMFHSVVSLKLLPEQTFATMAKATSSLPLGSDVFLSFEVPNQQKQMEALQGNRRVAFSMSAGKRGGMPDLDSEAKLADLESLLHEMVTTGEKVCSFSLNLVLRSRDKAELDGSVSAALRMIQDLGGAEAMVESLAGFDVFSEVSIPNASCKERRKQIKASNLADFIPVYGNWQGHERASVLLKSRGGQLVKFDPFDNTLSNANQIVSGGSGSGKSFLTNLLLLQLLKENPRIYIIDIGGSYRKLCECLGGQYIDLGMDRGVSLNPFDLNPGEMEPSDQKLKFLVNLAEILTKNEGDARLPKLLRTELEIALRKVYEASEPSLSRLREILLAHADDEVTRLGRVLGTWTGKTSYGQILDQTSNIDLGSRLVCFDLKGLESHPDLQAACLFVITDLIWREVQLDKVSKKFLVFDECWQLLESDAGAAFIGNVFRTFRKYYASAIAISQNMDDFAKSKSANAIMPNAALKWILRQRGADRERLKQVLNLNDRECGLVDSLVQKRGHFSEALLMTQEQNAVVRIESTPEEYWIATTDPRESAVFEKCLSEYQEQGLMKAIERLAVDYPHGVLGEKN